MSNFEGFAKLWSYAISQGISNNTAASAALFNRVLEGIAFADKFKVQTIPTIIIENSIIPARYADKKKEFSNICKIIDSILID